MNRWIVVAVLLLSAFRITAAESPRIKVGGGVYRFDSEEVYLEPFSISKFAVQSDTPTCGFPTMYEYLIAAKQKDFVLSKSFEEILTPPQDICTGSPEELEAEGVTGNDYFAGIGSHIPKEGFKFVRGGTDPRDSISSISSTIFGFWDEEYKPSPRAFRCVERNENTRKKGSVRDSMVSVYASRDANSKIRMKLEKNAPATILFEKDGWMFIESKGAHSCQPTADWDVFEDRGWVRSSAIANR